MLWGGIVLATALLLPLAPRIAAQLPACGFRSVTGFPCLACGSGRTILALTRFDLQQAFVLNPLACLGMLVFGVGGVIAGVAAVCGWGVPEPRQWSPWIRWGTLLVVLANWGWLILDGR